MDAETIYQVLTKLIGKVEPVGDSSIDKERLDNMYTFINVFDKMHTVIDDIAYRYSESPRHSEKMIGQLCDNHLQKMGISE